MLCVSSLANAQTGLYNNEFALQDVELLDGPFRHARDLNVDVLLSYDTDRLLAPYMKAAGLEPKGESFPNWTVLTATWAVIICRHLPSTMPRPAIARSRSVWIIC